MKSNQQLQKEFFSLIDEFNTAGISELAAANQRQIPYIELLVLEKACRDFTQHNDDRSIRALLEAGFQIFAEPRFLGFSEFEDNLPDGTGMNILHMHWTEQTIPSREIAELMTIIYENYYEAASAMFLQDDRETRFAFGIHETGLTELKAYHDNKDTYPKVVDDISVDHECEKIRLKSVRPLVKYAL